MKNIIENKNQSVVSYYRVQGGKPPLASYKSVYLDERGKLELDKNFLTERRTLKSVFFGDTEFMQSFLMKRATGFLLNGETEGWNIEVIVNVIPRFVDDFISKNAQTEMRGISLRNPVRVSHGPGIGYQLNNAWRELFFACALETGINEIPTKAEMRKFLLHTALRKDINTTKIIDSERFFTALKEIIACKTDKSVKLKKNEEPNLIGLNTFFDQIEKNYSLFDIKRSTLSREISYDRRQYNSNCQKPKI